MRTAFSIPSALAPTTDTKAMRCRATANGAMGHEGASPTSIGRIKEGEYEEEKRGEEGGKEGIL